MFHARRQTAVETSRRCLPAPPAAGRTCLLAVATSFCLWQPVTMHAQNLQATLSHYSTVDGLSSNTVSNIKQDDNGFVWIATWNGISRFDGYEFYNYKTGNGSHIPFLHNRIEDIVIDTRQNVWMRMYDGRVFAIDRKLDKIVNPLENVSGSEELRTTHSLKATSGGDVLASFDGVGLYKMRIDHNNPSNSEPLLITTTGLKVNCMAEGYHNDIWVGTDKGVHRLDMSNLTVERKALFPDENITQIYSNGYNIFVGTESGKILTFSYGQAPRLVTDAGQKITALFVDSYDVVWYSDMEFGICRFRPSSNDIKRFTQNIPIPEYDSWGATFHESMGIVWAIMNHGGYGYYDRETDDFKYFHNDPTNPWNLSNTVYASLEVNEGVVFESTKKRGLEKLEIQNNTISKTLLIPDSDSPIDNEIRAMYYDEKRHLLFLGNKNNTMFIIRPDGSRTMLTHDNNGTSIGRPYGFTKDSKGNYWLSSKDRGVFLLKPRSDGGFDIRNFCHDDNDKWSLSSNAAYQTVEDRQGNIWVATFGGGVNVLVPDKKGGYRAFHSKNVIRNYPYNSFQKIRNVELDSEGNVWAGSSDGILIMSFNGKNIKVKRLENSKEHPDDILQSTDIVCMKRDYKGAMWVGTNGGGLSHTIGKDSHGVWLFESYSTKDGLPSEEIRSIAIDKNNNIWFATDMMLCSFDVHKKIFSTFGSLEGVGDIMLSEGAAIALPNGNILFGTLNGYYTVDRKKLSTGNGSMLKLRITDVFLNDELLTPRLNDYYDYYIPEAKSMTLPNHDCSIGVRFVSLNYQLQHRVHYQYMLEGYDQQWQNADKSRTAYYSSLPTGVYRLKVKAFLLESPDNYDERTLEIIIPPYFLLSKNATWLYMFLAAAGALLLFYLRQRHLRHLENIRQLKFSVDQTYDNEEDREFINHLKQWLESNYMNPRLRTDELMTMANMSRSYFHNRLNDLTGQTPEQYVTDFRLKKAIALLEQSDRSIVEIAQMTGFGNALNITRAFKQRMGLTPEHYREQHQLLDISAPMAAAAQSVQTPVAAPSTVSSSNDADTLDDDEIIED
jgi:ligand-binding sensor domain-containing protein/AraC-like DNA-binding protein